MASVSEVHETVDRHLVLTHMALLGNDFLQLGCLLGLKIRSLKTQGLGLWPSFSTRGTSPVNQVPSL